MATLGSLSDLLRACELVADLAGRQALIPGPSPAPPAPATGLPTEAVAAATALLAGVIAKAAVSVGTEVDADE